MNKKLENIIPLGKVSRSLKSFGSWSKEGNKSNFSSDMYFGFYAPDSGFIGNKINRMINSKIDSVVFSDRFTKDLYNDKK